MPEQFPGRRFGPVQMAVLFAALATSAALWYLLVDRPASDEVIVREHMEATRDQLEIIRHSVREQVAREAGHSATSEDERQRILARTQALLDERLAEADIPTQLHPVMRNTLEIDVMSDLAGKTDTMASRHSDTELQLYRRAPGPGPAEYY